MKNTFSIIFLFSFLSFSLELYSQEFSGGDGTEDNPFLICTAAQLNNVRNYCGIEHSDKHFLLINDIDLGVPPYNQGEGWVPIGNKNLAFYGKFYGHDEKSRGGIIKNLTINRGEVKYNEDSQGLFGWIENGALIKNVGLENFYCCANRIKYIGDKSPFIYGFAGLVGLVQSATVENCYTIGYIYISSDTNWPQVHGVGGIVGLNYDGGSVKNCYTLCTINSDIQGVCNGSIVGHIQYNGEIFNCYAIGKLSVTTFYDKSSAFNTIRWGCTGIITGWLEKSIMKNCVAIGENIENNEKRYVNRLIGYDTLSSFHNNYALNTITINNKKILAGSPNNQDGGDKTLAELQDRSFYESTLGWDFNNIWTIKNKGEFPTFKWQHIPRNTEITANPIPLKFGNTSINTDYNKNIAITNTTLFEAKIETAYLANGTYFKLKNNLDGSSIKSLDSVTAEIILHSNDIGIKTDTLIIQFSYLYDCDKILRIPLSANVNNEKPIEELSFQIRADSMRNVSPNLNNCNIPIYIKSSANISNIEIDNLTIEIDRKLFVPNRSDNGKYSSSLKYSPIFNDTVFEIRLYNLKVPHLSKDSEIILSNIIGSTLLGDIDSSLIYLSSVQFSSLPHDDSLKLLNGFLTLDICRFGGARLLQSKGYAPTVSVLNNPASTILTVECKTLELGTHSLSLIDLAGNVISLKSWDITSRSDKDFNFVFPLTSYGNGNYLVLLETPTSRHTAKFVIVR